MDINFHRFTSIYVIVFKSLRLQRVHTYPDSLRFQKFPLWRPFSKVCGYSMRFRRIRVDAKRNRNKMLADTNESGYVWTGPKYCFPPLSYLVRTDSSIYRFYRLPNLLSRTFGLKFYFVISRVSILKFYRVRLYLRTAQLPGVISMVLVNDSSFLFKRTRFFSAIGITLCDCVK